jgi:hypothetical protein
MNTPQPELLLRLLFILHRGWIEARMLAQRQAWQQLYDLTDALEPLPAAITRWNDDELNATRFNLTTYETKHNENAFKYSQYLDLTAPPPPPF